MNTLEDISIRFSKYKSVDDYAEMLSECIDDDFEIASPEEREKIIEILINEVEIPLKYYHHILYTAACNNNIYVLEKLLNYSKIDQYSAQYNGKEQYYHHFFRASISLVHKNRSDLLKILLEKFPYIDYSSFTKSLLEYSYKHNNQKLTNSLLENISISNGLFDVSIFERLNESNHEHFSR